MPSNPNELRAKLSLPRPEDSPLPEAANFFHFAFAGPDMQMMVGYVDPRNIHALNVEKTTQAITPQITHRFLISPSGFQLLRKQLEEIGPQFDAHVRVVQGQPSDQRGPPNKGSASGKP